ncbi:MAG: porin [Cytophagaceae bacterium]
MNFKRYILFFYFFLTTASLLNAQTPDKNDSTYIAGKLKELKPPVLELKDVEIVQQLQLWDVNTFENAGNTPNQKRNDLYIRRGRLGVRGKLRKDLSFLVVFAYDGVGRDKNTAGNGNTNDPDNHDFYLWDAIWTWSPKPMLNLTAGYFRPQVGRENISSAFNVISLEKSLPNFQPRTHLIGRNTGRETGLNLGGFHRGTGWSFNYNIGVFDMTNPAIVGNGSRWFPMLTSRVAFSLGDPEMDKYKLSYVQSYYGQRKGITIAANASCQGETEVFRQNNFYGVDILANYGRWDFVAEYDWLYRNSFLPLSDITQATTDRVYSFKAGYNFILKSGKIIQATGMYSGQMAYDYGTKPSINSFTGATDQEVYDAGINYLINKDKLKLNLHYVWGKKKDKTAGTDFSYLATGFQYTF